MALRGMLPHSLTSTRTGDKGVGGDVCKVVFIVVERSQGSEKRQHEPIGRAVRCFRKVVAKARDERVFFGGRANRCTGGTQTARSELCYVVER